jgi:hypothetical protein
MANDTESVVRVTRYVKTVVNKDYITRQEVRYKVALDWGIGSVDNGLEYTLGSPYQQFSNGAGGIYGDAIQDSRVLSVDEELQFSQLTGAPRDLYGDVLHFKHPNI